jgi:hypothetical protein
VPGEVDRVGRQRQAEVLLDARDQLVLLPVGVLGASQRDQKVVGLKFRDSVRDDGQDAAAEGHSADLGVDRVHVAEHGVEALVGEMPESVDLISQPGEPSGQGGCEDIDLGRFVDDGAHRGWQFVDVGDGGIGDEEQPLDRRSAVLRGSMCSP